MSQALIDHIEQLRACRLCPEMHPPVVTGEPIAASVMLVGQAPGDKEGGLGKPFAWTAGKTLFRWFSSIGLSEAQFRHRVYMAAVCRCFPGKNPKGGDRVPAQHEISNCARWLEAEIRQLRPQLLIPVGKLAISQFIPTTQLKHVVGTQFRIEPYGVALDAVPLPHPSGASTWHRTEPGQSLLKQALRLIFEHPAWQSSLVDGTESDG